MAELENFIVEYYNRDARIQRLHLGQEVGW